MARRRNDTDAGMGCLLFMGLFVLGLIITYWYVAIPVAAIIGAVMAYRPLAVYFQREEDRNAVEAATRKTEARRQAAESRPVDRRDHRRQPDGRRASAASREALVVASTEAKPTARPER